MYLSFKLRLIEPLTVGGYLALLLVGAHLESREGWIWVLGAIAVLAFLAWMMSFRRALAITDTPTSKVASAAQGYVELVGRGLPNPEAPVLSKLTVLPCLWCRYRIERRTSNNKWELVDSGILSAPFLLDDGTERCLVDPDFAEVVPRDSDTWTKDGYKYTEWLLVPQDKIYVIGQFSTVGGANSDLDFNRDVSTLLAQWKVDKAQLLKRFDLNQDGEIGEEEWMLARQQAKREVRKQHRQVLSEAGRHVVHKPSDGRLFLISNLNPAKLARRYQVWTGVHLLAFLASTTGAWWLAV
jgi:hypothetical protein